MKRIVKILIMAVLLIPVPGFLARAAEVNLVPSNPVVDVGSTSSVDIAISLDEGEVLAGGVIDLGYDDSKVEIRGVVIDPYWEFLPDPGSKTGPGLWEGIGFDSFENDPAAGNAVIATITLEALAAGTSELAVLGSSEFYSAKVEIFPAFTVASIRVNTPPVISGTPATSVDEDTAYGFTPAASDDDGDPLTFSITNPPGWASFDTTTGALTGTPTNADVGTTQGIIISVTDGIVATPVALPPFSLEVRNVNDAPVISGTPATVVDEDTAYGFTPAASDDDGDPLTFSITNPPGWASFDTTTGALTGTPTNADVGTTQGIIISVTDGIVATPVALPPFSLEVRNVNDAPVISGTPATVVDEDTAYGFTPAASDDDGDPLTFSITNPPGWASFDTTTGALTGTPTNADVGTTQGIIISVTDGIVATPVALPPFSLEVRNVNDAPVADAGFADIVIIGTTVTLDGSASSDSDSDDLTFIWTFVSRPDGSNSTIDNPDPSNPISTFVPDVPGTYVVQLIVNDGTEDSAPATVAIIADLDTDNDGVPESLDNCTAVANADQRDTDDDGYGNMCDGDLNNDGATNTIDLYIYKSAHRTASGDPGYDPDADFNGDGEINALDLNIYKGLHRLLPGPSCCGD